MSVYRPRGGDGSFKSPYYHYDFVLSIAGERRRFHGSTGEKTKARALVAEEAERRRLKDGKPHDAMTLEEAADRYCLEVTVDQASADDTEIALQHCCRLIGGARRLVNITPLDVADAARLRAGETFGKHQPRLVTKSTANRQVVEMMRRLLRRARKVWKIGIELDAFDWKAIRFREPEGRTREFTADEADRFWAALRADYVPFVTFLATRGFRIRATLGMERDRVDLRNRRVEIWLKGRGWVWRTITRDQVALLSRELALHNGDFVWSFAQQRGRDAGLRRRITYDGCRRVIANAIEAARVGDFRIHDLRHDFASKLLRATRNLALVQKALDHSDIASTVIYAHVLDEDLQEGLAAMPLPGRAARRARRKA